MLTLTINDFTLAPGPAIDVKLSSLDHDGVPAIKEAWTIKGTLTAASPEALAEQRDALEAALYATDLALSLSNGDDTLRELAPDEPLTPPRCVDLKYDAHDPARLVTKLGFTARVEAITAAPWPADTVSPTTQVTFAQTASGLASIITELTAAIPLGTDETAALSLLAIPPRPGMRRSESRILLRANGTATHRVVDEETFVILPSGVTDGHVTTTTNRGTDGRVRKVVAGHFIGPSAAARARELRPTTQPLLAESITEHPAARRVDFRYETLVGDGLDVTMQSQSESITYTERRRVIELALLSPSTPPHRQEIGPPAIEIIQRGEAIGASQHPPAPDPLYPADVIEREVEYSPTRVTGARRSPPTTRWRYVMRPDSAGVP